MEVGDTLALQIEKMAFGGRGLARHEGRIVFVSDTLPGEQVVGRIEKVWRDFVECSLVEVKEASPDRVAPSCPLVAECGGCQWMHIAYPAQLRLKEEVLRDTLQRVGGIPEPQVLPAIPSKLELAYRHRGQFKVGLSQNALSIGFYREQSHDLVDIPHCPVFHPALNEVLGALRKVTTVDPSWTELIAEGRICAGSPEGKTFLLLMPPAQKSRKKIDADLLFEKLRREVPHLAGLAVSKNGKTVSRAGNNTLRFELLETSQRETPQRGVSTLNLIVRDGSFYQANWPTSSHLISTALEFLDPSPDDTVLDLYAGVGNFSMAFASRARKVIGVEEGPTATDCARKNASLNGIVNFEIMTAPSEKGIARIEQADLIHLDPPRQGASPKVLEGITRLKPRRVVYTSCNPSTLARDLKFLTSNGFRVGRIQPVDMFPQTYHTETVVELITS